MRNVSECHQQYEKSQCLNNCFWQVCCKDHRGKEIPKCLSFSLAIFVQKRGKILKWEIYMCFEVMQEVNRGPHLKISELWTRNEMLQDLWRVGVQWMCILRNDLHFNEVYYTWEAIAWLSFLSNDFVCDCQRELIISKKL